MNDWLRRILQEAQAEQSSPREGELYFDSVQDKIATDPNAIPVPRIPRSDLGGSTIEVPTINLAEQQRINALADKQRQLEFLKNKDQKSFSGIVDLDKMLGSFPPKVEQGVTVSPGPATAGMPTTPPSKFSKQVSTVQSELDDLDQFEKDNTEEELDQQVTERRDPFADAAASERRNKMLLALGRSAETIGRSMAGGGVVTAERGDGMKALEPLVSAEMDELKAIEEGRMQVAKGRLASLELASAEELNDPNSELSLSMRKSYADSLTKIGKTELAKKITDSGLSAQQLKQMLGAQNLANMEAMYDSAQNRLAQAQMTADARKLASEQKNIERQDKLYQDFRKELDSGGKGKELTSLNAVNSLISVLERAANDPSPFGDYATLLMGLKILQGDDSVVRGEEMKLGMQATSFANSIKNQIQAIKDGRKLQPEQRRDILRLTEALKKQREKSFATVIQPVLKDAEHRGLDLQRILPDDVVSLYERHKGSRKTEDSSKPSWAR